MSASDPRTTVIPREGQSLADAQEEAEGETKRQTWHEADTRRQHKRQQEGRDVAPITHEEEKPPF